ncbi:MAG: hypothetical protein KatS3mg129_0406 [Leptospiraceae bacterium]|nr:MAG: hypothetical protein KatS3mg129_0406 [Leptospiraceae bacterium]
MTENNLIQMHLEKKIKKSIKKILKHNLEKVINQEYNIETIHKYRVYIRRLRSILEEFINEIKIELNLIYELREFFRKLGKIRDYDILIENLEKYHKELQNIENKNLDTCIEILNKEFEKKRKKRINQLIDFLDSKKYKKIIDDLEYLKDNIKFKNFYISDSDTHSIIFLILSKFYKLLSHSYWNIEIYDIKALHHLRRQIKRTRYYMELFKKFYKKNDEYKNIINQLKELQDISGEIVDLFVLKDELEKFQRKHISDISDNNESEIKLSNTIQIFDLWLQEKEAVLFNQWNEKKKEFYESKDHYVSIIKENCRIEYLEMKDI